MNSGRKFKNKVVFWNLQTSCVVSSQEVEHYRTKNKLKLPKHIIRFDSTHEFKVYLELCRMYGSNRVLRQHEVKIAPPSLCYPNGKTWRCDFAINGFEETDYYEYLVEAKGLFMPEYGYILSMLETHCPFAFYRLRTVFVDEIPIKKRIVQSLMKSEVRGNLITFKKLQKLNELP